MLLHAPRRIARAEAIPRLADACALREPTMFSPKQILGPHPSCSQAQKTCRSNDVH